MSFIRSSGRSVSGLRGANVRVEKRLDGALAVRYGERYLPVTRCDRGSEEEDTGTGTGKVGRQAPASRYGAAIGIRISI